MLVFLPARWGLTLLIGACALVCELPAHAAQTNEPPASQPHSPDTLATGLETGIAASTGYALSAAAVGTLLAATLAATGPLAAFGLLLAPALLFVPPLAAALGAILASWPRLPWWGAAAVGAGTLAGLALVTVPFGAVAFGLLNLPNAAFGVPLAFVLYVLGPAGFAAAGAAGLGALAAIFAPPSTVAESNSEMR